MELEREAYKFKISEKEYESLREEIIQRIILINTQANNAIAVELTMWATGLGLFGIQFANIEKMQNIENLFLYFGEVGIFFCAALIMVPLSLKSGENLRQQASISAYIRAFYYYGVTARKIESEIVYPWEYANAQVNDIYSGKHIKMLLKAYNIEYSILVLVSIVFTICANIINYSWWGNEVNDIFSWLLILCSFSIILLECGIVVFAYKQTNCENNISKIADEKLKQYMEIVKNGCGYKVE